MSTGLGFDPSDPLNLLLNSTQNGDASSDESSQESSHDWSKFSTLWADNSEQSLKPYSDIMDFSELSDMPTDMDFNPSMTIEPSALYDPMKFSNSFSFEDQFNTLSNELLASQFPFSFHSALSGDFSSSSSASPQSFTKERRLSITSSSSSSGASLSPVAESVPSPPPGYVGDSIQPKEEPCVDLYVNDPAAELAQRVRQSAGVMLAVPMNVQLQGMGVHIPVTNVAQGKLPIPRLPRNNSTSTPKSSNASVSSSAASTPPPSTPPSGFKPTVSLSPASVIGDATAVLSAAGSNLPRPKTSHTTIERRYRTNLNARIQSLRMAVPALRVLEDREGGNGKKIKKNVKGSVIVKGAGDNVENEENAGVDMIDERGFVDGVKVARKCSKANVLGKAVEYIRVLKKREQRLKAEQAGLKTLISGLVGGPALVREWEKEWRANFGGEEKDEVEGEDEEGDDDDSDEEDGEDGDDDGARKRKRAKLASVPAAKKSVEKEKKKPTGTAMTVISDAGGNAMPEKRKRGRPRKILPPPVTLTPVASAADGSSQDEVMQPPSATTPQWTQQQTQPQQFLLGVFALFSFFNSPLTASPPMQHAHQHTGIVLSATPPLAYAPDIISQFPAPVTAAGWGWKEYIQLFHLLVSVIVLASLVGNWFGLNLGPHLEKVVTRGRGVSSRSFSRSAAATSQKTRKVGPTNWVELGEECVLEARTTSLSFYERLQMYRSISAKRHASVTDLVALALIVRGAGGFLDGFAHMKASSIWVSAMKKAHPKYPIKISEKLVFDTLDIDDAAAYLARATVIDRFDEDKVYTPIQVLGAMVVKERVKKHLGSLFVYSVAEQGEKSEHAPYMEEAESEWRQTIEAARELGGHIEELGKMLELAWKAGSALSADDALALDVTETDGESSIDTQIQALLAALILYRELFPHANDGWLSSSTSTLLSPPLTPTSKASIRRGQMLRALRTVLGNRVFEDGDVVNDSEDDDEKEVKGLGLEDARDRVVDMIFDAERPLRALSPSS